MAPWVEKAVGVRMETRLRMQNAWNIVQTCQCEKLSTVRRYRRRVA